ncbi:MAG TPA: TMEM165/GDT1 family protein [Myxococcales bacterium]|nr:TMEM165/GDT1 family protein [Myxococcales bacterium]
MTLLPLFTSFALIFLAELPDKTLYLVLLQATRNRPAPVLLGAWAAFAVQTSIALLLGSLLKRLPHEVLHWAIVAAFLVFGLLLLFGKEKPDQAGEADSRSAGRSFATTFWLVFAAEFGDATQIGTAALVARFEEHWLVFVGSLLALWAASALAVMLGSKLGARLPKRVLRRAAGALFCVFALVAALQRS